MKKKRFKFEVSLTLYELNAVPFVNGFVFAKLKLKSGGSFMEESKRCSVSDHRVRWDQSFTFNCHMVASANEGVLNPCLCRVSLRKETKGGKSVEKMGYVDVNLAQYAGAGQQTRRSLLKGYSDSKRQDNSVLKLGVALTLRKGDPCFKAPSLDSAESATHLQPPGGGGGPAHVAVTTVAKVGHSRSSSTGSSFMMGHSRQSSLASSTSFHNSRPSSEIHSRSPSDDMTDSVIIAGPPAASHLSKKTNGVKPIDRSRLSAVSVVEKLLAVDGEKEDRNSTTESSSSLTELKLYLSHDGSATVAGMDLSRMSGAYTAVTLPK